MSVLDPQQNGAMAPFGDAAIPPQLDFPLDADAQGGKLQFITIDPSTGLASPADDNTPGQIAAGLQFPDELSATASENGAATIRVTQRAAVCLSPSTIANDGFSAADVGVPVWIASTNTPGKLSHTSTKNRSLAGLCLGLATYGGTAIRFIGGVVGQLLGRAAMMADSSPFAWFTITDAAANTATAERAIPSSKIHGVVSSVTFAGAAVAANNTDYVTITIKRYTEIDSYAAGITVATYDSRAANQGAIAAFTPAAFALSGTAANLNRLESDIFTITVVKGGSGKQLIGEILVNGKAI